MLHSRLTYSCWPSFLLVSDSSLFFFFFRSVYFDLRPVKVHNILQELITWKWLPEFEWTEFYSSPSNLERRHYACTRTHLRLTLKHRRIGTHKHTCDSLLWLALGLLTVCKQSCPGSLWLASSMLIRAPTQWPLMPPATNTRAPSNNNPDNDLSEKVFWWPITVLSHIT